MSSIGFLVMSAVCLAQTQPSSPTLGTLQKASAASGAAQGAVFDLNDPVRPSVTVEEGESLGARPQDFGDPDPGEGDQDDPVARAIERALRSKPVRDALDDLRKEQSQKFAKEVVDDVMKDKRVRRLAEGPSKSKTMIVQGGIAGAGALLAGIGFAAGPAALGFLGLGILAAGLIAILIAFIT